MIAVRSADCEMHVVLPATLAAAESFFIEFRNRSEGLLDSGDSFAAELLLREALTNAVVHGCGCDPRKQVRCVLRLRGGRLVIAVEDQGAGFDWRAGARESGFAKTSGRGMTILRVYANRVRYNEPGNRVTIVKRFEKGRQQ